MVSNLSTFKGLKGIKSDLSFGRRGHILATNEEVVCEAFKVCWSKTINSDVVSHDWIVVGQIEVVDSSVGGSIFFVWLLSTNGSFNCVNVSKNLGLNFVSRT